MKRIIAKVFVFLLLGAVVNVAVAWFCALRLPWMTRQDVAIEARLDERVHLEPHWIVADCIIAIGSTQHEVVSVLGPVSSFDRVGNALYIQKSRAALAGLGNYTRVRVPVRSPRWSRIGPCTIDGRRVVIEAETAAGWPVHAVWGCLLQYDIESMQYVDVPTATYLIGETQFSGTGVFGPTKRLPHLPIWPGFAINTFFYAAILWLLFAGPGRVRRWRRIRRGLCAKCAYPVGTSDVCTECGAAHSAGRGSARQ